VDSFFSKGSKSVLGPALPPISLGLKMHSADRSTPSVAEVKNEWGDSVSSSYAFTVSANFVLLRSPIVRLLYQVDSWVLCLI